MAPGRGAYRINVTFRFKVRRSERFVEKKEPTKRFRGWVYSKKAGVISIDFSLNNFSLDRGNIGCPLRPYCPHPPKNQNMNIIKSMPYLQKGVRYRNHYLPKGVRYLIPRPAPCNLKSRLKLQHCKPDPIPIVPCTLNLNPVSCRHTGS